MTVKSIRTSAILRSTRATVGQIGYLVYFFFFVAIEFRVEFRFRDIFTRNFFIHFPSIPVDTVRRR